MSIASNLSINIRFFIIIKSNLASWELKFVFWFSDEIGKFGQSALQLLGCLRIGALPSLLNSAGILSTYMILSPFCAHAHLPSSVWLHLRTILSYCYAYVPHVPRKMSCWLVGLPFSNHCSSMIKGNSKTIF